MCHSYTGAQHVVCESKQVKDGHNMPAFEENKNGITPWDLRIAVTKATQSKKLRIRAFWAAFLYTMKRTGLYYGNANNQQWTKKTKE